MHLSFISLSVVTTTASLNMSESIPVCFYGSNSFNPSHSSIGFPGKNFAVIPGVLIAGDLSNLLSDLFLEQTKKKC